MKKIVIMSDNHGDMYTLTDIKVLEDDADYYIHCGDSEFYSLQGLDGFVAVKGNNDWNLDLPETARLDIEGRHLLITHGQYFGYFDCEKKMIQFLKKYNGDVLISGHTHMPLAKEENGLWLINPGSTSWPRGGSKRSYAVVTIDDKNVDVMIKTLE